MILSTGLIVLVILLLLVGGEVLLRGGVGIAALLRLTPAGLERIRGALVSATNNRCAQLLVDAGRYAGTSTDYAERVQGI